MNSSATTIPQSTSASLNKWPAFGADEATKRDSIASTLANDDFINLEPRRVPIVGGGSSCTSMTSAGYTDNALALAAGSSLTKVDYSSATATSFGTPSHTTPNTDRLVLAERFKTKLCRAFERKEVCQYGYNCMFAHSEEEKRTVEMNMKDGLFTQEAIDEFRLNQRMRVAERAQKALQLKQKSVGIHLPHVTLGDTATETTRKLSGPAPAYRPPQQPPLLHGISTWPLSVPSHAVPISTTPMITQSYPISYDVPPPTSHQPGHQTVVGYMPMTTALAQPRHGPSNLPLQAPKNLAYTTVVYATVPVIVEPPLSKRKRKARLQEQQVRQELWEEQQQQLLKQYKQQLTPPIEVTSLTDVDGQTGLWRGMGETDQLTDFGPNVPPTTGLLHLVADNMSPHGSPEPPHPNHTHHREVTVDNEIIESFGNSVVQQVVDSPTFGDVPQTRRQKKQQRLKEQLREEQQQNPHTVSPFPHSAYMATTQQLPVYVVPAQATGQQQITPQMLSYQTPTLYFNPDVAHATNRPTGPTHYQLAYPQVPATVNPAGLLPHHPIATLQFPLSGAVAPYQYLQ